ncbi:hypothetical protein UlMin_003329 [Ulmus minor]
MEINHLFAIFYNTVFLLILLEFSIAVDTITSNQSITDHGNNNTISTLVSSGEVFELGFFSPGNSKNRYIGIWHKNAPNSVVWVANRYTPFTDSFGELKSVITRVTVSPIGFAKHLILHNGS